MLLLVDCWNPSWNAAAVLCLTVLLLVDCCWTTVWKTAVVLCRTLFCMARFLTILIACPRMLLKIGGPVVISNRLIVAILCLALFYLAGLMSSVMSYPNLVLKLEAPCQISTSLIVVKLFAVVWIECCAVAFWTAHEHCCQW